jgi:hypothetical protein
VTVRIIELAVAIPAVNILGGRHVRFTKHEYGLCTHVLVCSNSVCPAPFIEVIWGAEGVKGSVPDNSTSTSKCCGGERESDREFHNEDKVERSIKEYAKCPQQHRYLYLAA